MAATENPDTRKADNGKDSDGLRGSYVYGIVPSDVEFTEEVTGVGDPPIRVDVVRHGNVAALVSQIRIDRPLGTPEDLMAHEGVLDAAATVAPVLPLRFGAVMTDLQAVSQELLAPHAQEFQAGLDQLEGYAQFVVKARYVGEAILREVLEESAEARSLRDAIRQGDEDETRAERIRLGELVGNALASKREADTGTVVERVRQYCASMSVREPSHQDDAVHLALLVKTDRQGELQDALTELQNNWDGRATVRLLGPLAPYDFVVSKQV